MRVKRGWTGLSVGACVMIAAAGNITPVADATAASSLSLGFNGGTGFARLADGPIHTGNGGWNSLVVGSAQYAGTLRQADRRDHWRSVRHRRPLCVLGWRCLRHRGSTAMA